MTMSQPDVDDDHSVATPAAAPLEQRRCVFVEIFRSALVSENSLLFDGQYQQNQAGDQNECSAEAQQQYLEQHAPITPYLVHQIFRGEGFAQKILLFQQNNNRAAATDITATSSFTAPTPNPNVRRGVVQFPCDGAYDRVMARFGSRNGVVVFLQGVPNVFLRVRTKPARDPQVYVHDNTNNAIAVVNQECVDILGPICPRTSSNEHGTNSNHSSGYEYYDADEQQQQRQQQPVLSLPASNTAPIAAVPVEVATAAPKPARKRYQAPAASAVAGQVRERDE